MVVIIIIVIVVVVQPSLPTPFYSVLVSVPVFMAHSAVFLFFFHSINFPDNSLFSHSALPVLVLPYWFFQLYISGRLGSTHQLPN